MVVKDRTADLAQQLVDRATELLGEPVGDERVSPVNVTVSSVESESSAGSGVEATSTGHGAGVAEPRSTKPIQVLVIDDQELFRRGLTMLLTVEPDIEVIGETGDVLEGTKLAATVAPDVVLIDIRMTKRSGIQACLAIKEAVPSAKILILTVSDEEEADLLEAVKSGASGYLLKDSSMGDIAKAIRMLADGQSLISPSTAVKLIDEFDQMSRPEREHVPGLKLTDRELEVLKLVARGENSREIARDLFISENTVKNHMRNILEKLQLHSRMETVMEAVKTRLPGFP